MSKKMYEIYLSNYSSKDYLSLSLKRKRKRTVVDDVTGEKKTTEFDEPYSVIEIHKSIPVKTHICDECRVIEKGQYANGTKYQIPHPFYYTPYNNDNSRCPQCNKQGREIESQNFQRREVFTKTDEEMLDIINAIKQSSERNNIVVREYSEGNNLKEIEKALKKKKKVSKAPKVPKPEKTEDKTPEEPPEEPEAEDKTEENED